MNWISGFMCVPPRGLGKVFQQINPAIGNEVPFGYYTNCMERPFTLNPLDISILRGHREAAEYLASFYDDTRIDDLSIDEQTGRLVSIKDWDPIVHPLHLACYMGMTEVVKIIVDKGGADVNTVSAPLAFATPLMLAVTRRHNDDIINYLLVHGADVTIQDEQKRSALEYALQFKAPENARRMVTMGCSVDIWMWSGNPHITTYSFCALYQSMTNDANLEVTQAIFREHPELPDLLWRICLHRIFNTSSSSERTIRWCVEKGLGLGPVREGELTEELPRLFRQARSLGSSALHYVASDPKLPADILEALVEKRPQDINLASVKGGWTPLSLAIGNCGPKSQQVALLLSKGADPSTLPEKEKALLESAQVKKSDAEIEEVRKRYRTSREIAKDELHAQIAEQRAEQQRGRRPNGASPPDRSGVCRGVASPCRE
ncbi:hypothetical protein PG993_013440 [Apiospora rasikravindrae]|uniref:Ankyrin n=1 Tax=Apiospora rasikravindrae TaxID=990691 RepID=A0ABR1RY51_9PEZI